MSSPVSSSCSSISSTISAASAAAAAAASAPLTQVAIQTLNQSRKHDHAACARIKSSASNSAAANAASAAAPYLAESNTKNQDSTTDTLSTLLYERLKTFQINSAQYPECANLKSHLSTLSNILNETFRIFFSTEHGGSLFTCTFTIAYPRINITTKAEDLPSAFLHIKTTSLDFSPTDDPLFRVLRSHFTTIQKKLMTTDAYSICKEMEKSLNTILSLILEAETYVNMQVATAFPVCFLEENQAELLRKEITSKDYLNKMNQEYQKLAKEAAHWDGGALEAHEIDTIPITAMELRRHRVQQEISVLAQTHPLKIAIGVVQAREVCRMYDVADSHWVNELFNEHFVTLLRNHPDTSSIGCVAKAFKIDLKLTYAINEARRLKQPLPEAADEVTLNERTVHLKANLDFSAFKPLMAEALFKALPPVFQVNLDSHNLIVELKARMVRILNNFERHPYKECGRGFDLYRVDGTTETLLSPGEPLHTYFPDCLTQAEQPPPKIKTKLMIKPASVHKSSQTSKAAAELYAHIHTRMKILSIPPSAKK